MAAWPYCWPWPKVDFAALERDAYLCLIQGEGCTTTATHVDHIVPPIEGGAPFDLDNLRSSCAHCNTSRGRRREAAMARLNRQTAPAPSHDWFAPT